MYAYVYDAFNRLVEVKTTDTTPVVVGQHRYNGLGQRIAIRHDEDLDGQITDDPWFNIVYDERWRMIAVYHEDDKDSGDAPKERFMYHAAGADGRGGSSYIDDTILRDRDHNTAWAFASDGTLERRDFYCQNWRADVVALVESDADVVEHVRYGLSGEPWLLSPADVTYTATDPSNGLGVPNGVVNSEDFFRYSAMYAGPLADPRTDFNHDGTLSSDDYFAYLAKYSADSAKAWGPGVLSNVESRKGYAGYENDRAVGKLWHVRFRVLDGETGRWLKRDPLRYIDGDSLYSYVRGARVLRVDPLGLAGKCACGSGGGGGANWPGSTQPFEPTTFLPEQYTRPYPRSEFDSLWWRMNQWLPHWWSATGSSFPDAFDEQLIRAVVDWVGSEDRAWRCFAYWAGLQSLKAEWLALYDVKHLALARARMLEHIRAASAGALDGSDVGAYGAGVAIEQAESLANAYQDVTSSAYGARVAKALGLVAEFGGPIADAGVAVADAWPHFAGGDPYAGTGALLRGLGAAGAGAGIGTMIGGPIGGLVGGVIGLAGGLGGDGAAAYLADTTYRDAMTEGGRASHADTISFLDNMMRSKQAAIRDAESWFMYYCGNVHDRPGFFSPGRRVGAR